MFEEKVETEVIEDKPCMRCGKSDQPEWVCISVLLLDRKTLLNYSRCITFTTFGETFFAVYRT